MRILIADKLDEAAFDVLADGDFELVDRSGIDAEALAEEIAGADALVVRSRTKVTDDLLARAKRLRVIGRAGTGIDNIDLEAATARGILVMNTPGGNSNSAAEHAICLMLALSRNVAEAAADLRSGAWRPKQFTGVEVRGKTLGIIGLGRIGSLVAEKAHGLGMEVIGFDPLVAPEAAARMGVDAVDLASLAARSDFVTLHVPLVEQTRHLVNREFLSRMKPTARLINCARGGIVDEDALAAALDEGRIAGAALDVFEEEPPVGSPLLTRADVVATPHLGASTVEAQATVARVILTQIADHLAGRGTAGAVNGYAIDPHTSEEIRPWLDLARRLGRLMSALHEGTPRLVARYYGETPTRNVRPLTSFFLAGFLERFLGKDVNEVSAWSHAARRGIVVDEVVREQHKSFRGLIYFTFKGPAPMSVAGTLFGTRSLRVVRIGEYNLDAIPEGWMLVVRNLDEPGTIGRVGTILGEGGVNIANLSLGRDTDAHRALAVLNLDSRPEAELLAQLESLPAVESVVLASAESTEERAS